MSGNNLEKKEVFDEGFYMVIMADKFIRIEGGPSFAFTLVRDFDQKQAVVFFNTGENKLKNTTKVGFESIFAKLYRLATGRASKGRYLKMPHLSKNFLGISFYCRTSIQERKDGSRYYKVDKIAPVEPFYGVQWIKDDALKMMPKVWRNSLIAHHEVSDKQAAMNDNGSVYFDDPRGKDPVVCVVYDSPETKADLMECRKSRYSRSQNDGL